MTRAGAWIGNGQCRSAVYILIVEQHVSSDGCGLILYRAVDISLNQRAVVGACDADLQAGIHQYSAITDLELEGIVHHLVGTQSLHRRTGVVQDVSITAIGIELQ